MACEAQLALHVMLRRWKPPGLVFLKFALRSPPPCQLCTNSAELLQPLRCMQCPPGHRIATHGSSWFSAGSLEGSQSCRRIAVHGKICRWQVSVSQESRLNEFHTALHRALYYGGGQHGVRRYLLMLLHITHLSRLKRTVDNTDTARSSRPPVLGRLPLTGDMPSIKCCTLLQTRAAD